ncbi:MAG: hypothetical protein DRR19_07285 [Candidatus Parabeggiatoa sp. nov. 1]|nr:MAG: hypothetical protein DRR19_07285 [Gammaproteobacteria bacterium]
MNDFPALYNEEYQQDGIQQVGSLNHSLAQARITTLLSNNDKFTTFIELSLDASQIDLSQFGLKAKEELKPDICLYPNTVWFSDGLTDTIKMSEMPLLAIEIISPTQGINEIFALSVKSCWLVVPAIKSVTVYSQPTHFKTFADEGEIIDNALDIRLPLKMIFTRQHTGSTTD